MDTEKQYTKKCKPEIGRGCSFCDCGAECEAKLCDGCFKLHETAWLEEYPENIPTDIVEVRFKNTRRSFYQNANNLQLKRGDIVAVEASPGHDIGVVSLTGDLVARQMRRTGFNLEGPFGYRTNHSRHFIQGFYHEVSSFDIFMIDAFKIFVGGVQRGFGCNLS